MIAGVVAWHRPGWPVLRLNAMLRAFQPPGMDGVRAIDGGTYAFGITASNNRLALVPGIHETARSTVVIDGRIDNRAELTAALELGNDASDAQIVASSYEQFGIECFARFRGDFAILIWDSQAEKIVAARDTFGIRPLCYALAADWIACGSDPEQLLAARLASSEPDDEMVVDYLRWDARFVDRTFFRDIKALAPGHHLVGSRAQHCVSRYRPTTFTSLIHLSSRNDYREEYKRRFRASVRARLVSNGPVVAELSGGLDSSSIVCVASRILAEEPDICRSLTAASALYPGYPCDEEPFIRAVERHSGVSLQVWNGTDGVTDELDRSSIALPGGRFPMFGGTDGQARIAHMLGARVLLSGLGGDQVGTPTGVMRDAITSFRWRDAARMVLDRPARNLRTVTGAVLALSRSFLPQSVRDWRSRLPRIADNRGWLRYSIRVRPRPRPGLDAPVPLDSEIQRRTWRAVSSGMHVLGMTYAQHWSLRSGLDARYPFLDLDLLSLVLATPTEYWPPPWPFERLHRDALASFLPTEITSRRGKGEFSTPLALRVTRHLPWIRETFASSTWRSARYIDPAGARSLLKLFVAGNTGIVTSYAIWAIATVEAWLRATSGLYSGPPVEGEPNV